MQGELQEGTNTRRQDHGSFLRVIPPQGVGQNVPDGIPLRRHNWSWLWQKVKDPEKPWQSQDLAHSLAPQQATKNVCEWI